jgi:hypothetical protein
MTMPPARLTRPERPQHRGTIEGQQVAHRLAVLLEHLPVVHTARGHQQHDGGPRIVPQLQPDPALERLRVPDVRLALDERGLRSAVHDAIPRSEVALDRERHLTTETKGPAQSSLEPIEQRELGSVPHGRPVGVVADRRAQGDRGSRPPQLLDRRLDLAALLPSCAGDIPAVLAA